MRKRDYVGFSERECSGDDSGVISSQEQEDVVIVFIRSTNGLVNNVMEACSLT